MKPAVQPPPWLSLNAIAFLGIFLAGAGLIAVMYHFTRPGPVDQSRWAERTKNLTELEAQNKELLEHYGWVNQTRGVVRLPLDRALELTAKEWQNPAFGRSNLLARLEKALPPLPAPATNAPAGTNPPVATNPPPSAAKP
jgi:hypothetical protein